MTRKPSAQPSEVARIDVYQEVTNQIITLLEAGSRPWSPTWGSGAASLPLRHEGTAYRGVNVLLLWSSSMSRGYALAPLEGAGRVAEQRWGGTGRCRHFLRRFSREAKTTWTK